MNQGILKTANRMAPWGRLMHRLQSIIRVTPQGVARASAGHPHAFPIHQTARPLSASAAARPVSAHPQHRQARSPLRVIRVVEAGQASALAGRILMSGRMADVCEELDRMVERETG